MTKIAYLFVYGSLLKNHRHPMAQFLDKHACFIGEGYFQGKLYKVDWFPGAITSEIETDKVFGHVFKITNTDFVFSVLDDYEGIGPKYKKPYLFKKELVSVCLKSNSYIKSWVYLYNLSVDHLDIISSGDYLKFTNQ